MSRTLIEKLRRARQSTVESGGLAFTVRRPTDLEMYELSGKMDQRKLLERFVVDWKVTEVDLGSPGGGPDLVPFDPALWIEWIADHPQHWDVISEAVVAGYRQHKSDLEESAKNLQPGLDGRTIPAGQANHQTIAG
jgi:hypothetical protein